MISVIIPTCNRNELLSKCLERLNPAVQNVDELYEVIVTDDSKEYIARRLIETEFTWVKFVKGPGKGPAANRNNGAAYASGEWLVFIDDDCLPDKNIICNYVAAIQRNITVKVFEGCIKPDKEKKHFAEESPINENGGNLWSCNFMINTSLFNELKGFDIAFPYAAMEDSDLQCRIKKCKEKILFVSEAYVIHPWRKEKNLIAKTNKRFQSTLYFLKKHPEMESRISPGYFFRSSLINFKNAFTYGFKFKFRGFDKQIILSLFQMYFAIFLFFRKF